MTNGDFWQAAWDQGRIGFHQNETSPYLQRYWPSLNVSPGSKVLVPLCGKSRDMLWLREQGHTVIGVEIVQQAVEAFFAENRLSAAARSGGPLTLWTTEGIEILQGDFFDLTAGEVAGVGAVYERASLVALPPDTRRRYAGHLRSILPAKADILLVTMDYPQAEMNGPPFAVSEEEVAMLYGDAFEIVRVSAKDVLEANPRFRERGLSQLTERVYILRAR
ncbi:MAG TPA: thiopurine S-methyltransferase [Gammaproteobacteria bacterium]|nr:thiopurine S-methyltransferase [Gammaproteobacteria bacterium]